MDMKVPSMEMIKTVQRKAIKKDLTLIRSSEALLEILKETTYDWKMKVLWTEKMQMVQQTLTKKALVSL